MSSRSMSVSLCAVDSDGIIHALRPDAPQASPWTVCRVDLPEDARLVVRRIRGKRAHFLTVDGTPIDSPNVCPNCVGGGHAS